MQDMCEIDLGRKCPHNEKIALIEQRLTSLEEYKDKEETFWDMYYKDREENKIRSVKIDDKINNMDTKITSVDEKIGDVKTWVDEQKSKPAKRWEGIANEVIKLVVAGVVGYILAVMGLGG